MEVDKEGRTRDGGQVELLTVELTCTLYSYPSP